MIGLGSCIRETGQDGSSLKILASNVQDSQEPWGSAHKDYNQARVGDLLFKGVIDDCTFALSLLKVLIGSNYSEIKYEFRSFQFHT